MQEFENVKQALQAALELADAKVIKVDGSVATTAQLQELFKESLINIADLLGMEELYLGKNIGGSRMGNVINTLDSPGVLIKGKPVVRANTQPFTFVDKS